MRFKSLQTRLTFIFGMCFLLTLLALGAYGLISSWRSQASFLESSSASTTAAVEQLMEEKAQVVGLSIKAELEIALDSARTIADSLAGMRAAREVPESGRALINSMLRNVLMRNEHFVGVYTSWEPGALDGKDAQYAGKPGHDETGRFIPYWSRGEGGRIGIEPLTDYENHDQYENGVRKGEYYLLPRERKSECVIDPYPYVIQGKTVWITSLVAPIIVDGIFRGIGGVDLRLDFIQSLADGASQDLFGGAGSVTIVTGDGIIAASSGKPVSVGSRLGGWERIQASIGQRTDSQRLLEDGAPEVAATVPLQIGRAESAWAVLIRIPKDAALAQVQEMVAGMERQGKIQLIKQTVVGLLVSVLALIIIWYASLSIAKPLRRLSSVAATIADGDLRAASSELQCKAEAAGSSDPRPEEQDEPGQLACAFRRMVASLGSLIGEVQHSGIQVTSSATEIAASARQLESTVSEQAAGTAQVMTAAREILSTTRGLAQTIESISAVAEDTASLAGKSQARLATTEAGMERLVEATAAISAGLSAIRDKADGIGGIITTITKVADQTNLLSLNAAIEAEKAGEYGVGFSVVAREIRRLADQTAAATLDIEDMIKAMRKAVTSGVVDTDKFIERVREGGTEVREVGAQMSAIIEQVRALTPRLSEVSRAMQVQCTEAEQINESITQISSAAQQTRDSAEEFNKVAQQLSAASRAMSKEVMAFKVDS